MLRNSRSAPILFSIFLFLTCVGCNSKSKSIIDMPDIDIQGHRGCRGLLPENTTIAFKKAIELGVHTLELDVVANKYNEVIVSHEPFFNHEISTAPDGQLISEEDERNHNMYEMTLKEIQAYDVGTREHPRFLTQEKIKTSKPSLAEMVIEIEAFVSSNNYDKPEYNIEIKRVPDHDGVFHPKMEDFADVVCQEIVSLGIGERSTVQCFDIETLQYVQKKYPDLRLVLLIQNMKPFLENIETLGFKPWAYSPYFKLVSKELVDYGQRENVKIIPWTVNEEKDIQDMISIGVDGIISDYPDRVVKLIQNRASK